MAERKVHIESKARLSVTISRLERALAKKRIEIKEEAEKPITTTSGAHGHKGGPKTLASIIMKFRKLKHALDLVKTAFLANATPDGTLNFKGLMDSMTMVHGHMTEEEVRTVFDFVDLDESLSISMKEFLVALCVGYCLEDVPILDETKTNEHHQKLPVRSSSAKVISTKSAASIHDEVSTMLDLIIHAYILFDPDGKGVIEKQALANVLGNQQSGGASATTKSTHTGGMVTENKWNEMDWDANGFIDFAEFVFSFASWVDLDEELEDDTGASPHGSVGRASSTGRRMSGVRTGAH